MSNPAPEFSGNWDGIGEISEQESPLEGSTTARRVRPKEPAELLLRLLLAGVEVQHRGRRYAILEDGSLVCVAKNHSTGKEVLLGVDCDLRDFFAMATAIGRDSLWLQCCGLTLRSASSRIRPHLSEHQE